MNRPQPARQAPPGKPPVRPVVVIGGVAAAPIQKMIDAETAAS